MGLKLTPAQAKRLLRGKGLALPVSRTARKCGRSSQMPPVARVNMEPTGDVSIQFPLVTISEPNQRDNWRDRHKRSKHQRTGVVALELLAIKPTVELLVGVPLRAGQAVTVILTRIGPKSIDKHDNLRAAFKAVVDEVATFLGVRDDDRRLTWHYAQEPDGRRLADSEIRITFVTDDAAGAPP